MTSRNGRIITGAVVCALCLFLSSSAMAQTSWPDVGAGIPDQGGGEADAAVVIGIEDYVFVQDIPGANQNAKAWYSWLVQGRGVPTASAVLLRDKEGTREKILRLVKEKSTKVGDGGRLWIVFVGHGAPARDGKDGVLVGADAQAEVESLYARSLERTELVEAAGGVEAIVVMDACFSGRLPGGAPLVSGLQPLLPVDEAPPPQDALFLAAAKGDQFAGPLPVLKRPAFSYLLLGALRGWGDRDGDGVVTANEALQYTADAMDSVLKDRRQTPTLAGPPDKVLALGANEKGPDFAALAAVDNPVSRPGAPVEGGGQLRITGVPEGVFDLELVASDGSVHRCPAQISDASSCTLNGLPEGKAKLRFTGTETFSETVEIGADPKVLELDPPYDWTGWAAIGSLGSVALGIAIITLGSSEDGEIRDDSVFGTLFGILFIELGVVGFFTFGTWYLITDYDLEETDLGAADDDGWFSAFGSPDDARGWSLGFRF